MRCVCSARTDGECATDVWGMNIFVVHDARRRNTVGCIIQHAQAHLWITVPTFLQASIYVHSQLYTYLTNANLVLSHPPAVCASAGTRNEIE